MIPTAIYYFEPSTANIAKFESIQSQVNQQVGYFYQPHCCVTGHTNILTNITDPFTQEKQKATIQKAYFCTGFEFDQELHTFMLTFDDVHYFDNINAANDFKNGITNIIT